MKKYNFLQWVAATIGFTLFVCLVVIGIKEDSTLLITIGALNGGLCFANLIYPE